MPLASKVSSNFWKSVSGEFGKSGYPWCFNRKDLRAGAILRIRIQRKLACRTERGRSRWVGKKDQSCWVGNKVCWSTSKRVTASSDGVYEQNWRDSPADPGGSKSTRESMECIKIDLLIHGMLHHKDLPTQTSHIPLDVKITPEDVFQISRGLFWQKTVTFLTFTAFTLHLYSIHSTKKIHIFEPIKSQKFRKHF